jgi:PAS domain S-box-containing protein
LWLNILHPDDKPQLFAEAQRALQTNSPFDMEVRYRAFDGLYRWFLVRAILIKDASGKTLWFGTSTDIDESKQVAEDLQESEARFSTLADAIPQIVFTADKHGNLDFFNDRWFQSTGLTKEQSEAGAWELLLHADDLPQYLKGWRAALSSGDSYETEFRLRKAVGKDKTDKPYRWHLGRAVALRDGDGTISKWFATWTEIEGQKTSD